MTQPHVPDGWPITHPRQHAGPGPVLAAVMAIGATAVVGVLVGLVILVAANGGSW